MDLPEYLYQHTLVVEPFLGNSSHGPEYGGESTYPCLVDDTTTLQLDAEGKQVVSSSRVFLPLGSNVPLESRVRTLFVKQDSYIDLPEPEKITLKETSRESLVLDRKRRDGGDLPTPNHLELILR